MTRTKITAAAAVVLFLPASVFAAGLAVTGSSCNLRTDPDLNSSYNIMLRIPRHYPLRVKDKQGDFFKVSDYKTRTGWIHNSVVGELATAVVKVPMVNIRKGPGTGYDILCKAQEGVAFRILEDKGKWLKVEHESNRTGWLYSSLVWKP